jgi:hypothetical protein
MSSGLWSAELALAGAGGEPVDLWRSIQSHGLVDLPPMVCWVGGTLIGSVAGDALLVQAGIAAKKIPPS